MSALTDHEKGVMRRAGFLDFEIKTFDEAKDVAGNYQDLNFQAENFQSMIRSRIKWIALLKSKGWDSFQISYRIKMLYEGHRSKRDSFMLLQAENSPSAKNRRITDNAEYRRRLARTRVTRTLGQAYGKDFRSTVLPKHVPQPPPTPRLIKDE
jgi:hypothetical protein